MLQAMAHLIQAHKMIPPDSTVLCAVSGGADSICLLHALYHLQETLHFHLAVAHYNHSLRGEESDRDAAFVQQFVSLCCGPLHQSDGSVLPAVPFYLGCGDVSKQAKVLGLGLEETGRAMRYTFLRETAHQIGASRIATAHNAGDNVETILFHLARGSGLKGLSGISPASGNLIRPLLTTSRSEIESYLAYYGLPYREDRTNADDTYTRNRIRHQVVPVLEELYPGFSHRACSTAAHLLADEEFLSEQARVLSGQAVSRSGGIALPAELLAQAPIPLAIRAIRQMLQHLRDGNPDCTSSHLESILKLCHSKDPSAQISLPDSLLARREYDWLILAPEQPLSPILSTPLPLPGQIQIGNWQITCQSETYTGQLQTALEFWLDRSKAPVLVLRRRQEGDRLQLAHRPERTLKKWFIDEKIPAQQRDFLPVFILENGTVAAVAGLGPHAPLLPQLGAAAWHITLTSTLSFPH
ncbi:MAG: tRNA lysidine(34) synthetase TilS [Lawsonibacter sp.]|jgi:tRNA(Ile)-lysidine synthase